MASVINFVSEDIRNNGVRDLNDIFVSDFEMIRKPKGSRDNPATSIINGSVINYENDEFQVFNVTPDLVYGPEQIFSTAKFLGQEVSEIQSGIEFDKFYEQLSDIVGKGVMVVWGDYDEKVIAEQCKRFGIEQSIKILNLQQSLVKFFQNEGAVRFQYHEDSLCLPLNAVYKALIGEEFVSDHDALDDARKLKDILQFIISNSDGLRYKVVDTMMLQALYLFNREKTDKYMTSHIKINVNKLIGEVHNKMPAFVEKGKVYENNFSTYDELATIAASGKQ